MDDLKHQQSTGMARPFEESTDFEERGNKKQKIEQQQDQELKPISNDIVLNSVQNDSENGHKMQNEMKSKDSNEKEKEEAATLEMKLSQLDTDSQKTEVDENTIQIQVTTQNQKASPTDTLPLEDTVPMERDTIPLQDTLPLGDENNVSTIPEDDCLDYSNKHVNVSVSSKNTNNNNHNYNSDSTQPLEEDISKNKTQGSTQPLDHNNHDDNEKTVTTNTAQKSSFNEWYPSSDFPESQSKPTTTTTNTTTTTTTPKQSEETHINNGSGISFFSRTIANHTTSHSTSTTTDDDYSRKNMKAMIEKQFVPSQWLKHFRFCSEERDRDGLRQMRIQIINQTMNAFRGSEDIWQYKSTQTNSTIVLKRKWIIEQIKQIEYFEEDVIEGVKAANEVPKIMRRYEQRCNILLYDGDCVDAASKIRSIFASSKNARVAILDMANQWSPGGGFRAGAGAQEENLHRRSLLHHFLENGDKLVTREWRYPLPKVGGLYVPNVPFCRSSEKTGYAWLEEPELFDVVVAAAIEHPKLQKNSAGELVLNAKDAILMEDKIVAIFEMARQQKTEILILSAFGAGAFGNPPLQIAKLFQKALNEYGYAFCFRVVAFAVLDDHNSHKAHNPTGNFEPFVRIFGKQHVMT